MAQDKRNEEPTAPTLGANADAAQPVPPAEWGPQSAQATADAQGLAQPNKNVSTPGDTDPGVRSAENAPGAARAANGNKSAKTRGGVVEAFLKAVKGVKESDILSYNDERQTVVTAQGGKYRREGGVFFTLGGPVLEGTLATATVTPPIITPQG